MQPVKSPKPPLSTHLLLLLLLGLSRKQIEWNNLCGKL
jgi:hypothetical protein